MTYQTFLKWSKRKPVGRPKYVIKGKRVYFLQVHSMIFCRHLTDVSLQESQALCV